MLFYRHVQPFGSKEPGDFNHQIWSIGQASSMWTPFQWLEFSPVFLLNVWYCIIWFDYSCGSHPATPMEIFSCNPIWVTYRFGLHRKDVGSLHDRLGFASVVVCMIIGHIENSPRLPSSHLSSNPGGDLGSHQWILNVCSACFITGSIALPPPLVDLVTETANRETNVIDQSAK